MKHPRPSPGAKSPSFLHSEPLRRRRSHVEASTLLDPTFSLVTRAMSTRLAVSKSRPIRDTRRPLLTRKVAEAPLSLGSARSRRTEGKRGGLESVGTRKREGDQTRRRVVRTDGANTTLRALRVHVWVRVAFVQPPPGVSLLRYPRAQSSNPALLDGSVAQRRDDDTVALRRRRTHNLLLSERFFGATGLPSLSLRFFSLPSRGRVLNVRRFVVRALI